MDKNIKPKIDKNTQNIKNVYFCHDCQINNKDVYLDKLKQDPAMKQIYMCYHMWDSMRQNKKNHNLS